MLFNLKCCADESGWAWFIPLHDNTVSVGVVQNESRSKLKKSQLQRTDDDSTSLTQAFYLDQLYLAPGLRKLLGDACLVSPIKSASDFSYSASSHAGSGYRIVGDAGAFIDPFFSSGVHLAFGSALSAAATIAASIRGDCSEDVAVEFHNARVGMSYTRRVRPMFHSYCTNVQCRFRSCMTSMKKTSTEPSTCSAQVCQRNSELEWVQLISAVIQGSADIGKRQRNQKCMQPLRAASNPICST